VTTAKTLLGTFVVAFALTVGAITVGAVVLDDDTTTTDVDHDHIDSSLIAEQAEDGGEIEMESSEPSNTIVIHTGAQPMSQTGMQFLDPANDQPTDYRTSVGSIGGQDRDVDPLESVLIENGHEVVYWQDRQDGDLSEVLDDADAFLTTGSGDLSSEEGEAIAEFAEAGGQTVIAADPGRSDDIGQLMSSQGLYTDAGYVYDLDENDNNYLSVYAEPTDDSALTDGVDRAVFRSVASVGSSTESTVMETDAQARHSTTREQGSYDVAAVDDNVALIGDSSFMTPENAHRVDNNVLVGNVADFLVTGTKPTGELGDDDPASGGEFGDEPASGGEFDDEEFDFSEESP